MTGRMIIYLPNWLGDMVMATPFLLSLKFSSPYEIWGLGSKSALYLYNGLEIFKRFIVIHSKNLSSFVDALFLMREERFEKGIILPHSFRAALLFFLSGIEERIGYDVNGRGFLLTKKIEKRKESTVDHYLRLLECLNITQKLRIPVLKVTEDEEKRFFEKHPEIYGDYGVFIVGASFGPSKVWPIEYFSQLAHMLTENFSVKIYILPGPEEGEIAMKIKNLCSKNDSIFVENLDVSELKVCLYGAKFVLSNDTGPRHIASAFSVPTFVLLGPMDEIYTSYSCKNTHFIVRDVPCRPCNKRICKKDHACMRQIKPEEVYEVIKGVLS